MWRSRSSARLFLASFRRIQTKRQVYFRSFWLYSSTPRKHFKCSSPVGDNLLLCRFFSNDSSGDSASDRDSNVEVPVDPFSVGDEEKDQISDVEVSEENTEKEVLETTEIDVEKLENILSFLQSTTEESLDFTFDKMDLSLSEEFVARVLQTPLTLPEKLIGFFKWALRNPQYNATSSALNLLVQAVSTSGQCGKKEAYMLWDLIKEISSKDKHLLTTQILNQLISLLGTLGKSKAALEVFNLFKEIEPCPNGDSYYLTIDALSRKRLIDAAWSVCEKMLSSGELPDSDEIGKIIAFFCKGMREKDAYLIYMEAKNKGKIPPQSYIDVLVRGLSRKDDSVYTALELLKDYSGESQKYAIKPFTTVVTALCRIKEVIEAKNLINEMINSGPPPGSAVFNHVISYLSKDGAMDDAVSILRQMESRGLRPDIYTYSIIMSGYAKGGMMDDARKIFDEAKTKHQNLISTTYHILIRGYCKVEEFGAALECMNEMKKDRIKPNADEYNKMVQSLCLKALDWRSAEKLLKEVKEIGLHLNPMTEGLVVAIKELEEEEMKSAMEI